MTDALNKTRKLFWLAFLTALILISNSSFSQVETGSDTIIRVSKGSLVQIKDVKSFIIRDTIIGIDSSLVAGINWRNEKTIAFYDSLESRASKNRLTHAIFDLVIVTPELPDKAKITSPSDEDFRDYSGIRIRNIDIKRLGVFGSDIENPGLYSPSGAQKALNSTHINTIEKIIRKNLLFALGDSISPLELTDNERILRELPYIDDARIIVVPVSEYEADIIVITKDVYSLGANFIFRDIDKGSVWLFDKNLLGFGNEFKIEIPYSSAFPDSPGIGLGYNINNIWKSFTNLNLNYYNALGIRSFGFSLNRPLVSSETKYGGGIAVRQMHTTEDFDTMPIPEPLEYNFQDYWLMRSFLVNRASVTRVIAGIRYINNNIYEKPLITPESYYSLQRFRLLLGSLSLSVQKYYKTNLVYNYGTTEDFPYGGLFRVTAGVENNEFKRRTYISMDGSYAASVSNMGYFHLSAGLGTFISGSQTEQGMMSIRARYVSNLSRVGTQLVRNFIYAEYTRGFNRYDDEYLKVLRENGFKGFFSDSTRGGQRINLSLESVFFSPVNIVGFRIAYFGFADAVFLAGTNQLISKGSVLTGIGVGVRIRNNNLLFNTFQIRIGYFPNPPAYSRTSNFLISGEQLLRPRNFDPGPPAVLIYR